MRETLAALRERESRFLFAGRFVSFLGSHDAFGPFVAIPIGLSLVGPIADSVGVRATLAGGAIVFVVTQASALLSRDFRTLRRREPQPEPESSAIASV